MNSKRLLSLSLAANGIFLGVLFVVWSSGRPASVAVPQASAPVVTPTETVKPAMASAPATPVPAAHQTWTWNDLEAADYPTYIRNLRGIGCPEETIRDIIIADVATLYLGRRQELAAERKLTEVAEEVLRQEQAALLAALLDPPRAESSAVRQAPATPAPAAVAKSTARQKDAPIVMPAVMADPAPSLNLTEPQKERLASLREAFISSLGGPDQDPEDPAYLSRWLEAQPKFDEQFKTLFGAKAFAEQQAMAGRLTAEEEALNTGPSQAASTQPRFDRQVRLESGVHVFR